MPLEFMTATDYALLKDKAQSRSLRPGELLIREGLHAGAVFLIQTGTVDVERGGARLVTLKGGDIVGEMSFLEGVPASASVIAAEPVTALAIPVRELQQIFEAFPHLAARFYRSIAVTLSRRLRETSRQLANASQAQAATRAG